VGPDKKLKLSMTYPISVGRNFAKVLRALRASQLTFNAPLAMPAKWTGGKDFTIVRALNGDRAREKCDSIGIKLPYLRITKSPK
jgi:alkyl hydroperoxide reductase subunit AhpC